jgi:hypothetical protein
MVHHTQINKSDASCQQNEGQNPYSTHIKKTFDKNFHSFITKTLHKLGMD